MTIFCIILIFIAPVVGWQVGRTMRSLVAAGRESHIIPALLMGTLPFTPIAFIFFEGVLRVAFLAFLGLMIFFAAISAKRVSA